MKNRREKCHALLQRRYTVTILGFLCSVVMHAQRLNISIAMVAMVNATNIIAVYKNTTECPYSSAETEYIRTHNQEFSWDPELQGYILSAGYLGYVLTQIPGGILSGMFGTKPVLLASVIIPSICNLLSPLAARQHPFLLAAVQLLRGMGQGFQPPAMSQLMSKWFPKCERGFLSAFIYCGFPVGAFIGSLVSGPICEVDFDGGWPLVFYTFGLVGLVVGLLIVFLYMESPEDDPNISETELQHILQNYDNGGFVKRPPTPWGAMLVSVPTYALIVALFGQYWMAFYFLTVHPTYMGTILNIPIKENGILSSGPHLAQAIAGFSACWLSFWLSRNDPSKVGLVRKGCNTLSCFVFALGMVGVYLSGCDSLWNEVCLFIATASVGFAFAGSLITAVDMSPTFCGVLMGFASTVASSAGFAVPIIVGSLTKEEQTLAQWHKMFLITAFVAFGSAVVFLTLGSTDVQLYDPVCSKDAKKSRSFFRNKKLVPQDIVPEKQIADSASKL